MNLKIRKDAEKSPVSHIIIIFLLINGLLALPMSKLFGLFITDVLTARLLAGIVLRTILIAVTVLFIFKYGFNGIFKFNPSLKKFLFILPALIVCINNAPIIGLISGGVKLNASGLNIFLYVIQCICIGVFEELSFRGLIFPLSLMTLRGKKKSVFWAIALSSAIFGISHLFNLFGGASVGSTFLQVGYSFLIGGMCAISICVTGDVYIAIILHTVYDIGGLLLDNTVGICTGTQWDTATIIITVIIGVAVGIFMLIKALKFKEEEVKDLYGDYITFEKEKGKEEEIPKEKEQEKKD